MSCDIDKKDIMDAVRIFGAFPQFWFDRNALFVQLAGIDEHDLRLVLKRLNNKT